LVNAFVTQMDIIQNRMKNDPTLFSNKGYLFSSDKVIKGWVNSKFESRCSECPWNNEERPMILPGIHGTSFAVAWKVCGTGFANLSSLDDGFYGKGIYFTTYAIYALPYFATKDQPSIIVSFLLPGNTYPCTEHPSSPQSKVGAALVSGYNSHYAITERSGYPPSEPKENLFDEIIIPQEAQIMPVLLIRVNPTNLPQLLQEARQLQKEEKQENRVRDSKMVSLSESTLSSIVLSFCIW